MKNAKKVLLLVLCAVLLVGASVMGTLAYLTSQDSATNTFTVGQVHIKLDEAKVDEYGDPASPEVRVQTNTYKLIPGSTYTKDPTVWVREDSEEAYIRMIVKISHYDKLTEVFGNDFLPQYFVNWDSENWLSTNVVAVKDNVASYEFRYKTTYDAADNGNDTEKEFNTANKLAPLFTTITFPGEWLDNDDVAKLEGLTITVEAHAVQAKGFENDEAGAWAAFEGQQEVNASKNAG